MFQAGERSFLAPGTLAPTTVTRRERIQLIYFAQTGHNGLKIADHLLFLEKKDEERQRSLTLPFKFVHISLPA